MRLVLPSDCTRHHRGFQLTAARCGWLYIIIFINRIFEFQLTAARCGWGRKGNDVFAIASFNSQPRDAAGPSKRFYFDADKSFNSQPRDAAGCSQSAIRWLQMFQLTAARCGWFSDSVNAASSFVSTHSRAMRLAILKVKKWHQSMFQLTAARCGWPKDYVAVDDKTDVSTHSRAMRLVTTATKPLKPRAFQLTAARCGWHRDYRRSNANAWFQLTAARCGWYRNSKAQTRTRSFNSQPRDAAGHGATASDFYGCGFNSQPRDAAGGAADHLPIAAPVSTHSRAMRLGL